MVSERRRVEIVKSIADKTFTVRVPLEVAWNHLADVERWPSWAKHIRSVTKSSPGPLSGGTEGTLLLSNGMRSRFRMTEFEPLRHWKWEGTFLGSRVYYDHIFARDGPLATRIRFVVDAEGWTAALFGGFFGRVYRKNLRRAIPSLVKEVEGT